MKFPELHQPNLWTPKLNSAPGAALKCFQLIFLFEIMKTHPKMLAFIENLAWRICRPRMVEPPKNRYVGGGVRCGWSLFLPSCNIDPCLLAILCCVVCFCCPAPGRPLHYVKIVITLRCIVGGLFELLEKSCGCFSCCALFWWYLLLAAPSQCSNNVIRFDCGVM